MAGVAALCSVPAHAVPVDCWWGDPRDNDTRLLPQDCDISKRVSNGRTFLDVYVKGISKRFSLHLTYENKSDDYGDVVFYHKGNTMNGHWQFDEDNDVALGVKGHVTHFVFSAKQLLDGVTPSNNTVPAQRTLSDTPFRF